MREETIAAISHYRDVAFRNMKEAELMGDYSLEAYWKHRFEFLDSVIIKLTDKTNKDECDKK